jgi:hypothetical protein
VKADHKKPAVAFAALVVLAAAVVGGQVRADAQSGEALASGSTTSSTAAGPTEAPVRDDDRVSRAGARAPRATADDAHRSVRAERREQRERKADRKADSFRTQNAR